MISNMLSSVRNINAATRLSRTATSVRFHGDQKGWESFKLSLDSIRRQDGIDIPLDYVRPELSDAAWTKDLPRSMLVQTTVQKSLLIRAPQLR